MQKKIVLVKNVQRLAEAGEALIHRAPGADGMGLVHGETGYGKTTAISWYVNHCNGIYARALALWSPSAMLGALLRETGRGARNSCVQMMNDLIEALALSGRPVFIDEADYLVQSRRMTETLRDLHDMACVPVVLIGMAGIDQRLSSCKQLTGRIQQEVRFAPLDAEDTQLLARELCDVTIQPDLQAEIKQKTAGSARLIVVALARIEQVARSRGVQSIGLKEWGKRDLFTGKAPGSGLRVVRKHDDAVCQEDGAA